MASEGPNLPSGSSGDVTYTGGMVNWNNASNTEAEDTNHADVPLTTTNTISNYLRVRIFGFSIPSGATIDGYVVEMRRKNNDDVADDVIDASVTLWNSGDPTGDEKSTADTWPTSWETKTFGAADDDWGAELTAEQLNDNGFGFAIAVTLSGGTADCEARVRWIRMTIYYTEASGATGKVSCVMGPQTMSCGVTGTKIGGALQGGTLQ